MKQFKRIAALIAVILWIGLIITTLVVSFINTEEMHTLFIGLIFTDIIFPIIIYAMMLVYRILAKPQHPDKE